MRTFSILFLLFILSFSLWSAAVDPFVQLGPMLGHTAPDQAHIWIKASGAAEMSIDVWEEQTPQNVKTYGSTALSEENDYMGTVKVSGLRPATRYAYGVALNKTRAMSAPFPVFTTPPEKGQGLKLRFAFVSCLGRMGSEAGAGWGDMAGRVKMDLLLMLGDNHYADTTTPAKQLKAYYSHRSVAGYREITARTSTYAIWDDHDFGPDNSDGTIKGKEASLKTFKQVWANPSYGEAENPGIYHTFSRGNVDFFMLDGRYHRTPNKSPDGATKTMLGAAQLAWLKRELLASKAALKFLAMGSEWQSFGTQDSWAGFKRERQDLFDFIEQNAIQGVMLLSGDRHFTGGYRVLDKWIEITSGPMGSKNFPTRPLPEMFLNQGDGKMYCILEVDTTGAEPVVLLEVYRAGFDIIELRRFAWDQINGRTALKPLGGPLPDSGK